MIHKQTRRGLWDIECRSPFIISDVAGFVKKFGNILIGDKLPYSKFKELPEIAKSFIIGGGEIKWQTQWENLVTNAGLDYSLDVALSGGSQISTWYVGLINGSPTIAAADTMSSHSGWTENTNYSESTRVTWSDGGVSSQSVTNSASKADFTCNSDSQTIAGAFLTSVSTKGGTSGTLYAAGEFASAKSLDTGDTLSVTATFTAADGS